jgi:phosphohistidine phosphatase SixA
MYKRLIVFSLKTRYMKRLFVLLVPVILLTACGHTYYVVRHAEKASQGAGMSSDVPLSAAGAQRAEALKDILRKKKIAEVYSTNTIRTTTTAKPTADYFKVPIQTYGPRPDSSFISKLRALKKNTLVVGHSNTVDEIVNGLTGTRSIPGDLAESEYNNLYVIKVKGKKVSYENRKYGM